ncbi:MAG TPA: hypothetical protein ENN80_14965, partial [Candidatus Hydrogenedentes bacterium]|nr:hypothetical protein [Candidatus Hydrogenedentota bacterium]
MPSRGGASGAAQARCSNSRDSGARTLEHAWGEWSNRPSCLDHGLIDKEKIMAFSLRSRVVLALALLTSWGLCSHADLSLPSIFSDHMVLQQGRAIPVWGTAEPGEQITVGLNGKKRSAKADADGDWMVRLRKQKAGGPYEMVVSGVEETVCFSDVLIGEVWVCSGQSNMQWSVSNSNNAKAEIAAAAYPKLRLFTVERTVATDPQKDCKGAWVACTPETIPGFTAVGYFFGRRLHEELGVPVGLIHTSWGGTPSESWTSRPALEGEPMARGILDRWQETLKAYPEAKAAYERALAAWQEEADKAKAEGRPQPEGRPHPPQGPGHPWTPSGLYNAMIAPLVPYAIQGAIWYQGESNAGRAYQYRTIFPLMIRDWRDAWDQGPFPFLFVQLANFTARKNEPGESEWAELREAQLMTLALKNTGMAVTIDIGEADDIHPRNKQDVGKRLALIALAETYGKNVVYSGPIYESMT